jgi:hypothetical protein
MAALEKEYDFNAFETYVREKEKVNMDYKKSLAEKSKLPKWLATWYYVGYEPFYDYKIEFESNKVLDFKTGSILRPRCYSKKDLKEAAILDAKVNKDSVKNVSIKKFWKESRYEGNSIRDFFKRKHFNKWVKKVHKKGIHVRDKSITLLPNYERKRHKTVGLWWSEDIYDYLIFKLTVTAMSIKEFGIGFHSGIIVHDMWKARNALIKLRDLEEDDYETVVKEMKKLYNVDIRDIGFTFIDEEEFLEHGNANVNTSSKAYPIAYNYDHLSNALNMPISTKEERKLFIEKVRKFRDDENKIIMDLNNSFEERKLNLWNYISNKLSHLNEWYD